MKTVCQYPFKHILDKIVRVDEFKKYISIHCDKLGRFYTFQRKQTWQTVVKAIKRRDQSVFKEKLKCYISAIIIEKQPQRTLLNKVYSVCNLPFLQQKSFRRD